MNYKAFEAGSDWTGMSYRAASSIDSLRWAGRFYVGWRSRQHEIVQNYGSGLDNGRQMVIVYHTHCKRSEL